MIRTCSLAIALVCTLNAGRAADPEPVTLPGESGGDWPRLRLGRPSYCPSAVLTFSPDGKILAATTNPAFTDGIDAPVNLWNADTGQHLRTLKYHTVGVMAAAFSPNGKLLATSGIDDRLRFWDVTTGKDITTAEIRLSGHGYALAFSRDGKRLLVGSTKLELYDVATQKPIKPQSGFFAETTADQFFYTATWSPGGKYVAAGCDSSGIRIWEAETGALLRAVPVPYRPPQTRFEFSADDKLFLVSTVPDGLFAAFDTETGKQVRNVKLPAGQSFPESLEFAREMGRLAWTVPPPRYAPTSPTAKRLVIVADATGAELTRLEVEAGTPSLRLSPDGSRLAIGGSDGSLRVYNTETGQRRAVMLGGWYPLYQVSYINNGLAIRVVHTNGAVHDFDSRSGAVTRMLRLRLTETPHLVALSPDARYLATAAENGSCVIWDLETGKEASRPKEKLFAYRERTLPRLRPDPLPPVPQPGRPLPPAGIQPPPPVGTRPTPPASPPAPASRPSEASPQPAPSAPPPPPPAAVRLPAPAAPPPLAPGAPPPPPVLEPGPPQFTGCFSRDGRLFAAVTGEGNQITVWETLGGEVKHTVDAPGGTGVLAFAADRQSLFAGRSRSTGTEQAEEPRPDGKASGPGLIQRIDLRTGKVARTWPALPLEKREGGRKTGSAVRVLRPSADGLTLGVVEAQIETPWPPPLLPGGRVPTSERPIIRVIDLTGRSTDRLSPLGEGGGPVAFTPDGLIAGYVAQEVQQKPTQKVLAVVSLVDLDKKTTRGRPLPDNRFPAFGQSVCFRPDGKELVIGLTDGRVLVVATADVKGSTRAGQP